ncbi:MAG: leucyl aminopeptidase [Gallionellales bacterium GWA2_60_142]|nr:MAG: leucyl aminopeptidase [Gallionellales bacterium GWA2_60_142]
MEFSIKQGSPEKLKSGTVVVGVYEGGKLSTPAQTLDKAAEHHLSDVIANGDMNGKAGSTLMLHHVPGIAAERVLLVGLGKAADLAAKPYLDALRAAFAVLQKTAGKDAALFLTDLAVKDRDVSWKVKQAVLLAAESGFRSDQLKSKPADASTLRKVVLGCADKPDAAAQRALAQAEAIANGMDLTKELGNLPGNICTPSFLAAKALALGKAHKNIKTTVLEEKDMQKLGMGSLKPGGDMDEMKYDMSGAGSVLGTMQAIAEMGLKLNVVGVIPTCENMPSGKATRPGDIVTSMSGQTIEILNTDAEGRLILCDALTYSAKFNPDTVIDIATLTGACVIALGNVVSGMFANDDKLAAELVAAGDQSHDRVWQLPLWDDYQPLLDSNFADMANIGGRAGGTITAACFLSRFTKDYRWAHLDIAGTANKSGKDKGATGRPVPLLTQYLINRTAK